MKKILSCLIQLSTSSETPFTRHLLESLNATRDRELSVLCGCPFPYLTANVAEKTFIPLLFTSGLYMINLLQLPCVSLQIF